MTTATASLPKVADKPLSDRVRMVELPSTGFELRASRADDDGSIGVLVGFAAVFNSWTEIDSWEGNFLERFAPGAFVRTIREDRAGFKVLYNHGFDPSVGDKPLGKPRILEERDKGLYMEVPLDDTSYNRDLLASLRSGAIDAMSVRFKVLEDGQEWHTPRMATKSNPDRLPERTITEVRRLYEAGPVTFAAYQAASAGVRDWKTWRALQERMAGRRERQVRATAKVYAVRADMAVSEAANYLRKYGEPTSRRERAKALQRKVLVARVQSAVRDATYGRVA